MERKEHADGITVQDSVLAPTTAFATLRRQIARIETQGRVRRDVLPFGVAELDARLQKADRGSRSCARWRAGPWRGRQGPGGPVRRRGRGPHRRTGAVVGDAARSGHPGLDPAGPEPDRVIYVEVGHEKAVLACGEEGLRMGALAA